MATSKGTDLQILLLADDTGRVALLRASIRDNGLSCGIKRIGYSDKASQWLRRNPPPPSEPLPDLVLFDFADASPDAVALARDIAFGADRSPVPVVLMTSPETESMLESGEIDDGEATMFTARGLDVFLRKLVGQRRQSFLRALCTLYQYGPIITPLPSTFLETNGQPDQLSA